MGSVHLPTRAFAWDGFPYIHPWYINRSLFGFLPAWLGHLADDWENLEYMKFWLPKLCLGSNQKECYVCVAVSARWETQGIPRGPILHLAHPGGWPSFSRRSVFHAKTSCKLEGKCLRSLWENASHLPACSPQHDCFQLSLAVGSLDIPRSQCQVTHHPLWGLLPACLHKQLKDSVKVFTGAQNFRFLWCCGM